MDLAFTMRPSKDDSVNQDDLNKQLWASVRSAHVDTALRFNIILTPLEHLCF